MENGVKNRVPQIIASYWLIKIAATTLGETGADHFSHTLNLGYASSSALFLGLFLIALIWKVKNAKFTPASYWIVFGLSSLAGTAISDLMDRTLGLGYAYGSLLLVTLLLGALLVWYRLEGGLSVESIKTSRAETLYWIAFLISNTLGTALGDFIADDFSVGFLMSSVIIALILVLLIFIHFFTDISSVFIFWIAFVLTRPFGATFGDLLTKDLSKGGMGLGTAGSSLFFLVILLIFIRREYKLSIARS